VRVLKQGQCPSLQFLTANVLGRFFRSICTMSRLSSTEPTIKKFENFQSVIHSLETDSVKHSI